MKIGTTIGLLNPKHFLNVALAAEKLGFESLWMPEHLVFPTDMSGSPFPGGDHPPVPPKTQLFDVFSYLAFLAAKTHRIRLGTNVFLLGLRHPFVAARAILTLDIVSDGRAEIGVGAGWLRTEWRAAGFDPASRGRRLDEALQVCKRLWTEAAIEHRGEFYQFEEVMFEPKPVQSPHPPIHIGGESSAALRRVARYGDGWYGVGHTLESIAPVLEKLKAICQAEGKDYDSLEIITGGPLRSKEDVTRWQDLGVTRLVVTPWQRSREAVAGLERLAAMVF